MSEEVLLLPDCHGEALPFESSLRSRGDKTSCKKTAMAQ